MTSQKESDKQMKGRNQSRRVHLYMFLEKADMPLVVCATAVTLLSSLGPTALSILMGRIFGVLSKYTSGLYLERTDFKHDSIIACFSLAALGGALFVCDWLMISLWMKLGEIQQLKLRQKLYNTIFDRQLSWFDENPELNGDIIQLNRCIEEIRAGASECTAFLMQSFASVAALIVTSFIYSWKLTLIIICSSPLIIAVAWFLNSQIKRRAESENDQSAKAAKLLDFNLTNPSFIKTFNTQTFENENFKSITLLSRQAFNWLCFYSSLNAAILRVLVLMMFVQAFWYGFHLIQEGSLTSETVITTFTSCLLLADTSHTITEQLIFLQKANVALEKYTDFINHQDSSEEGRVLECKMYPQTCKGEIVFENVSFSYPSRNDQIIIKDLTMTLPEESFTFIVGESGSGKSTLASLLLNFHQPTSGAIRIDGISVRKLSELWLTDNITLLEQNVTIFNDTLRNNIVLGAASRQSVNTMSQFRIDQIVESSFLQKLVSELPGGLDTEVGSRNKSLSGGELQRVAIARAKMKDTPILILDESLSALDFHNRRRVFLEIRRWRRGKTTIVITHDFSQIQADDFVVVLDNGKIQEQGIKVQLNGLKNDTMMDCFDDSFALETSDDPDSSSKNSSVEIKTSFGEKEYLTLEEASSIKGDEIADNSGERPEKLMSLIRIFKFMSSRMRDRWSIGIGMIFAVLSGAANPLFSFCFSRMLNSVVTYNSASSESGIIKWAVAVIGITVGDGASTFGKKFLLGRASESWITQLRQEMFQDLMGKDLNWYDSPLHKPNEISALLLNDSRDLRCLVSEFLEICATVSVMLTLGLTWSIILGWKLALVGISTIPLFMLITALYSVMLQFQENNYKTSISEWENQQHDVISGIRTIKCFRLNSYFNERFRTLQETLTRVGNARAFGTGFGIGCSHLLTLVAQSVILYYGLELVYRGEYSTTKMFETLSLLIFTVSSCSSFVGQMPDISKAQRLATYLITILKDDDMSEEFNGDQFPVVELSDNVVEFDSVSFTYPSRDVKALSNVSFKIKSHEVFGIVGGSGSGKSTISSLILKLQAAQGVKFCGEDISKVNTEYLRKQVRIVTQKSTFFDGTIKENLLYGITEQKTEHDIIEALKLSCIYDFVSSLPQGVETRIGNDTNSLISGGQAQRLCVARALISKPKILILDECTSALDPQTATQIKELIDTKLRLYGMTIIIITHHLELMSIADKILRMKDGRVETLKTQNPFK